MPRMVRCDDCPLLVPDPATENVTCALGYRTYLHFADHVFQNRSDECRLIAIETEDDRRGPHEVSDT